jgi:type I restriction enzyme, S subunit
MSSEWQLQRLSSLGEFDRGKSKHRPRDASHLYGGIHPFIQTGDVTNSDGRITSFRQTYSEAGLAQSRLWPTGTLAITIAANIAETALLTFPACFPDSVVGFIAAPKKADFRFVEYLFRAMRKQVKSHAYGSAQENINLAVLRKLEFPVPPLNLQRQIADFLSLLDDRIALLREINATLEAIAQALFKSWFVDFDPVRAKQQSLAPTGIDEATAILFPAAFEESVLGLVPKGWKVQALDEIATYLNGLALQKFPPSDDSWFPVIKIAQLRKGDTAGADRAGRNLKSDYVVQDGDVLFSWSGSLEVEVWCGGEGALNQHLFKVTSKEFAKWFYLRWTRYHLNHFRQIAASKATTMGHIQRAHLSEAKVLVPPAPLLDAMDTYFAPLLARSVQNELQAQALATLRDTLLPRLISGQLRLPENVGEMEEAA